MSWHVWFLHNANVLDEAFQLSCGFWRSQREIWQTGAYCSSQFCILQTKQASQQQVTSHIEMFINKIGLTTSFASSWHYWKVIAQHFVLYTYCFGFRFPKGSLANNIPTKRENKRKHKYGFQLKPYNSEYKPPGDKDLVYYELSPAFCDKNPEFGIQGKY